MSLDAQMAGLGMPPAMAAALRQRALPAATTPIEVFPENWPAVRVFCALGTQWRRAGMSGTPCGLDYGAIPAVSAMLGVPADADLLMRLRLLEVDALELLLAATSPGGR